MDKAKYLLDYAVSHPDAILTYNASYMVLAAHSDASYLTEPKARSRAGGTFFMSNNAANTENNRSVLTIKQIIKNVMTSAVDAEIVALYINSRQVIPLQKKLKKWATSDHQPQSKQITQHH